jgi:hypothetical protein
VFLEGWEPTGVLTARAGFAAVDNPEGKERRGMKELIQAGRLKEARQQLVAEVKAAPSDPGKRTLLFQALAFCGEWDKAETHLEVIAAQDVKAKSSAKNLSRRSGSGGVFPGRPPSFPKVPPYLGCA